MSDDVESFVQRLLATDDPEAHHTLLSRAPPCLDPRAVVVRLTDEANRLLGADPPRMEQLCLDALALADRSGDGFARAMAHMRYGDALRVQGRNADALTSYDIAATGFRDLGLPVEAARTRIGWALAAGRLGRLTDAILAARRARTVLRTHREYLRMAALDLNTGTLFVDHGLYREALRRYSAALRIFQSLGDSERLQAGRCHANRGNVFTRLGRYREALGELQHARQLYAEVGEHAGAARVTRSIGELEMDLGHYAAALLAFEEAQARFRALRLSTECVWAAQSAADCYLRLNRPVEALSALAGIEPDLERTQNPQEALGVATRRVTAYLQLDQQAEALAVMDDVERTHPTGPVQHRAWLAVQRAAATLRAGDTAEALALASRALSLAQAAGMRRLVAESEIVRGTALVSLGDVDGAGRAADRALYLARRAGAVPVLHRVQTLLGTVAEARGRVPSARRRYRQAIGQLEREQHGVIFAFRDSFATGRDLAFERLARLELQAGRPAEALKVAERAKSRALADAIAGRVSVRPRGNRAARRVARELTAAREDYAALQRHVLRASDGGAEPDASLLARLTAMEETITRLVYRLQMVGASADDIDLFGGAADPVFPVLRPGVMLVEFFTSGDDILRFEVDQSGMRAGLLPGALVDVERLLRTFRLNLDSVERAEPERRGALLGLMKAVLGRLHDRLLGGITALSAVETLVMVPHGMLHYLPFHALHDGTRYLIEQCAISYAPSAALYDVCRRRARRRRHASALILAHSANGQLPCARLEAEAVARILGASVHAESRATRALLATDGPRADVIHVAAHGQFRPSSPLFSSIALGDGPLTTADVFNLDLRAGLVTLSACETGRAILGGGDELVGLTRAFLYAGAAGLVVSQWRVDDAATAGLMTTFYRALARGLGSAQALRQAQLEAIAGGTPENDRAHPFFWAGFQFIGDDQPIWRRSHSPAPKET